MTDVIAELATLGELCTELVDQSGPTGEFVYVDISSIDREAKKIVEPKTLPLEKAPSRAKQVLQAGDVLVSMTRPNLNAVALVPDYLDGAIGSTGFHVLRSKWLHPKFLLGLVQSKDFVDAMSALVQGALYPAVRPKDIAAYSFRFEVPAQQARIVAKLEEILSDLDAGVAELKAAQKKLQQYRQSLLKGAVEGALTADWREARRQQGAPIESGAQLLARVLTERRVRWEARQLAKFKQQGKAPPKKWQKNYSEPVRPNNKDLLTLPVGWAWATIDQLTVEQRYGSSAKTNEDSTGVPVLRMGNIQDSRLDYASLKFLPRKHREFPKLFLQDGDMLFNRTNSPELVGKTAVYRSERTPCSYASYLIAVRFAREFTPEIAAAYINSRYGRHWIKSVAVQQVGQANVNGTKLAALAVPLPPVLEQRELMRALSEQAESAVQEEQRLERLIRASTAQRQNILCAAFAGELVPQDPNDEPATLLLKRIQAERFARPKQPRPRKKRQIEDITMVRKLMKEVLEEAGDWLPAQEVFRRCGVADGASTEQIETLYAELRTLDRAGRLAVEPVIDARGKKKYDKLRLLAG